MEEKLIEKIEKIKQIAESFDYWSMTLAKASNIFEEIIKECDEVILYKEN